MYTVCIAASLVVHSVLQVQDFVCSLRPLLTNLCFTNLIFFDRILHYNCSVDLFATYELNLVSKVIAISSQE